MTTLKFDLSEVEELEKAFDTLPDKLNKAMVPAMHKAVAVTEGRVVVRTPVFLGQLRGSIFTQVKGTPVNVTGIVASNLVYAPVVEFGRKPGRMPPPDALELWVRRKLGIAGDEARSVAFVIARAIGRRGTKAVKMFEEGAKDSVRPIVQIFTNMVNDVIIQFEKEV